LEPSSLVSFKVESGSMTIAFQGERSSELTRRIIPERDRPVIDNTVLTGRSAARSHLHRNHRRGFRRYLAV